MNRTAYLLAAALLLASCGGSAARTGRAGDATRTAAAAEPVHYTYRVKAVHPLSLIHI